MNAASNVYSTAAPPAAIIAATPEAADELRHPVPHVGLENGLRPLNLERIEPMRQSVPGGTAWVVVDKG